MTALRASFPVVLLMGLAGCSAESVKPDSPTSPATAPVTSNKNSTSVSPADPVEKVAANVNAAKLSPASESTNKSVGNGLEPTIAKPEIPAFAKPSPAPDSSPEEPPFQLEKEFILLTFEDFEAFGAAADTWEATDEGIYCTGKPRGYLYTKQPYRNFTLRLDYSFERPETLKDDAKFKGNTGFLIYITGEHKLWPLSLEVQGKHGQMGAIKENGGAQPVTAKDDDVARQKVRAAVGEWNSLEIVSVNGALTVSLNAMRISACEPDFLSDGLIGIQAEDFPFEVRRMRIRRD